MEAIFMSKTEDEEKNAQLPTLGLALPRSGTNGFFCPVLPTVKE